MRIVFLSSIGTHCDNEVMKKGKWKVIVEWEKDGKGYLFERVIFIT